MAKRSYTKTPMREQAPEIRKHNFSEVALGYSLEEGQLEAARCLQCKNAPCIQNCPVMIDIPGFIKYIEAGDMQAAHEVLRKYTNLPAICGRVCPQEKQCEMTCRLGRSKKFEPVAIGKLERLVADWALQQPLEAVNNPKDKGKVAVIGSGPSGLTAAGDLAKLGYDVTIFEALHAAGGVLTYGIPEFRLPKEIVQKEIESIIAQGVTIETNVVVGKTITMAEIQADFDACYLAVGAGAPNFMGIPGTSLNGVYSSSEYLTRINLMKAYDFPNYDTPVQSSKNVVVIGGGNVAMDAARSAKRLGAENVAVIYRRSKEELPAREEEYHHSIEEGIHYHWLTNPIEYISDSRGKLKAVKCVKMTLGEPDESGRRRPEAICDSDFIVEADTAIEAIGQGSNRILLDTFEQLQLNQWGYIDANTSTGETNIPGVFAGGDIVTGAATVILAMGAGKIAATQIDSYIQNQKLHV
ncbi:MULTISPECIES: NADPH-dependent glutamate synthase [Enterococcus]|uniref:Glutamate synthase (NADPH), homotetrameric n=1 Tax=Enterococcus dispar ATCC 51266 TaxID=1139219 RepID=S0KTK9_9ENTE|nr:NADPH-dependent glutamate synthase [Enterococcus dispar]EOT42556.1 glutamate synthase (NADPH), homotetrameric [Enterococcus dispar ATCC 51266]EOW84993.1 glutamate synthase (NADPH), homotetrameric [Enterococcus dispar ATCC 51266]MCU7356099.1 NADPH-dependent glutamate synthase [Enterococcus dispar]WCG33442.1 NADPH-dependent glutamate synthase [Enterococcus dispar]